MACFEPCWFERGSFHQSNQLYRPRSLNALSCYSTGINEFKPGCDVSSTWSDPVSGGGDLRISSQGFKTLLLDMQSGMTRIQGKKGSLYASTVTVNIQNRDEPTTAAAGQRHLNVLHGCKMKARKTRDIGSGPYLLKSSSRLAESVHNLSYPELASNKCSLAPKYLDGKLWSAKSHNRTKNARKHSESFEKTQHKLTNILAWVQKSGKKAAEKYKLKAKRRASLSGTISAVDCAHPHTARHSRLEAKSEGSNSSLKDVLSRRGSLQSFRKFLVKELSEENLDFWIEVEVYKKQKQAKQRKLAHRIYTKYLTPTAPSEVNVDGHVRAQTKQNLESPDSNTFELAQTQIYRLMESDSFRRFSELSHIPSVH